MFCHMPLSLCAQEANIEHLFYERYSIIGLAPCDNDELQIAERTNTNCGTITNRGKDYAMLFIPEEDDPILTIRINLIFIQKDDGSGNFQEDNPEHQSIFDDVIEDLNRIVSHLVLPGSDCFSGTDDDMVHDTRIRFVDHRYYIRNSAVWNNNLYNSSSRLCPQSNWYLNNINDSLNNTLNDTLKSINIYFTEDSSVYHHFWEQQNLNDTLPFGSGSTSGACSEWPTYSNWAKSSRLHFPCMYSKFWWMKYIVPQLGELNFPSWEGQVRYWFVNTISTGLAHELGHTFYLYHPTLDYNYPLHSYPQRDCWHSILQPSGSSPRNFLPPQEIGLMYFSAMSTNLQQYVPKQTCLGTRTLNSVISLPHMRMLYSLDIGPSGDVIMPCNIIFSPQCSIAIQNGGVLYIDDASLQSVCDGWGGIIVQSGGVLQLSNTIITDFNIVVQSGGILIVNNDLTIMEDHFITIEDGGYLCIDNSASISLQDEFSTIIISPDAILGCPSCNENCITDREDLTNIGNGHFVTYEGIDYIQHITITSDYLSTGDTIYAGYNVTNSKPEGNVVIENGGNLRIKANKAILTRDVEVKTGGSLIISK